MSLIIIQVVAFLLGGLGVFLLGMKFMSDGLQTVAGPSLKSLIGAATNNRIFGILVGVGVTCLVQSSSITTVMVIGFVNAEMMLLKQAIGVIMGANVGTTITGWVLVLNIGKYGLPLAGIFALIYCFVKNERIRYTALAVLGVGLVFIGLEAMKDALSPLAQSPEFSKMFSIFHADSFTGVIRCALIGCVLTAIVQSSSATLGITIAVAAQGLISFETAAALILGQNVGTTITAFLASLGTSRAARRAALFHIIFNTLGAIWVIVLFHPYLNFIQWILTAFFNISDPDAIKMVGGVETRPYITAAIATFHTTFNVVNLFLFLPFTGMIAKGLEKVFTQKIQPKKRVATKLDYPLLASPVAAVAQSERELRKMVHVLNQMMDDLRQSMTEGSASRKTAERVFAGEDHLDTVQTEVTEFLTQLLSSRVSQATALDAERQLREVDDLETASDYIAQLQKLHLRMNDKTVVYNEEQKMSLLLLHDTVKELLEQVITLMNAPENPELLANIRKRGAHITGVVRELRENHWGHLASTQYDPLVSTTYTDMLNSYRKIKEHLVIAAEIAGGIR